ncbi:DNA polymerase III subunit delta [bacterium]|nr:DNA polymerase III subunit delta [bacterium]
MSIHFFYGQEYYFLEKEIQKMKSEYLNSDFITMNYKVLDNPEGAQLIEACQNAPLMFGDMLTVIHLDKYLIGNNMSLTDDQLEAFEFSLKNANPQVHLVFVCKTPWDELKKPDSRKKFYKILTKYSTTKEFAFYKTWDKQLPSVLAEIGKENGLKLSPAVCSYIVEQMGVNLTTISTEFSKLVNAIYPRTEVEINDIKTYCSSAEDIFELVDLLALSDKDAVLKQYNALTEKKHPLEIMAFLQSGLSKYIFIKTYEKQSSNSEMGSKLGIHEFIVKKTREKLAKVSLDRLLNLKKNLTEAEYKYKTGQTLLPDLLIEMTLMR